jgi:hypothetical protein
MERNDMSLLDRAITTGFWPMGKAIRLLEVVFDYRFPLSPFRPRRLWSKRFWPPTDERQPLRMQALHAAKARAEYRTALVKVAGGAVGLAVTRTAAGALMATEFAFTFGAWFGVELLALGVFAATMPIAVLSGFLAIGEGSAINITAGGRSLGRAVGRTLQHYRSLAPGGREVENGPSAEQPEPEAVAGVDGTWGLDKKGVTPGELTTPGQKLAKGETSQANSAQGTLSGNQERSSAKGEGNLSL